MTIDDVTVSIVIPHEAVLFIGIYANYQFSTQRWLVRLAAITVGHITQG